MLENSRLTRSPYRGALSSQPIRIYFLENLVIDWIIRDHRHGDAAHTKKQGSHLQVTALFPIYKGWLPAVPLGPTIAKSSATAPAGSAAGPRFLRTRFIDG